MTTEWATSSRWPARQNRARPSAARPVHKLTVSLITTYRSINDLYFNVRKQRQTTVGGLSSSERQQRPLPVADDDVVDDDEIDDISLPAAVASASSSASSTSSLSSTASSSPTSTTASACTPNNTTAPCSDESSTDVDYQDGATLKGEYVLIGILGKGVFGVVVAAIYTPTNRPVAIKLIKTSNKKYRQQAETELRTLAFVQKNDPSNRSGIVRVLDYFAWSDHLCIVFERLSMNLYELLKLTRFNGLSLEVCQKMARQILHSLKFLASINLVHCDIKPENILLVRPNDPEVRLIDFSSCVLGHQSYDRKPKYVQSRYYRAPEILLGCNYGLPIDMWSLGCLLVELHTGEPLFPGQDQREMVQMITATLGYPPVSMLLLSKSTGKYFDYSRDSGYVLSMPISPRVKKNSLAGIIGVATNGPRGRRSSYSQEDYECFLDLVAKMLRYKQEERITPADALEHPFLSRTFSLSSSSSSSSLSS